jgi:hypothetical protein
VLKRGVDLFLYKLKRRRGETRNSNLFACFDHNSASYFSSNLELDLKLVYFSLKIELDLRLQLQLNITLQLENRTRLETGILLFENRTRIETSITTHH